MTKQLLAVQMSTFIKLRTWEFRDGRAKAAAGLHTLTRDITIKLTDYKITHHTSTQLTQVIAIKTLTYPLKEKLMPEKMKAT